MTNDYEKRSVAAYQKYPYMHRTAVDAILDTVLAHLPPKKIPALNKREEGYNEAINKMEDILMSGKGKSHD